MKNFQNGFNRDMESNSSHVINMKRNKISMMVTRYLKLPECFEKSLIKCLLAYAVKVFGVSDELNSFSQLNKEDIEKECRLMKERAEIEGIKSFIDINKIDEINNKFDSKYSDTVIDTIFDLHKSYQVLDIDKIQELLLQANTESAAIKNEDIILILGPTGCGKSTTIHYLMGSVMEKTTVDGFIHIQAVKNEEDPSIIDKVKTSPYPVSETNCILAIGLKKSIMRASDRGYIYLCDTPGFGDTNGCEVDIINSIGIVEGIKQCKSVRPVIIISYKDAFSNRMQGLASLSHILSGLIKNIDLFDDIFQFLFTNFPEERKCELKSTVEFLIDKSKDNGDPCFIFFLEQLLNELKEVDVNRFIDPLSDNREQLLKRIYKRVGIEKPNEYFKCSFDDRSKEKLKEQVLRHQKVIDSCIKNQDYSLVRFKLNELKFLKDKINLGFIKKSYEECLVVLQKSTNDKFNLSIDGLKSCIENSNVVGEKYVQVFKEQRKYSINMVDELKNDFSLNEMMTSEIFKQSLTNINTELINQINSKELDDNGLKILLDKLKTLSVNFEEIKYNVDALYDKLSKYKEKFNNSVKTHDFQECGNVLKTIRIAKELLQEHLDKERLKDCYDSHFDCLSKYLNSLIEPLEEILKKARISNDEKSILKTNSDSLQKFKTDLADIQDLDEFIKTIYEKYLAKILAFLENTQNKTKEIFSDKENSNNFSEIETYFVSINTLFEISEDVRQRGASYYYCTLDIVYGYINELRRDIENDINKLNFDFDKDNTVTYKSLYQNIKRLEELKWIDQYKSGAYSNVKSSILKCILDDVRQSKYRIEKMNFDLENYENIKNANSLINKMIETEKMADFIPEIKQLIDEAKNITFNGTKDVFDYIEKLTNRNQDKFDLMDFKNIEAAFHYLRTCKDAPLVAHSDKIDVNFKLENYIKEYRIHIEKKMDSTFQEINAGNVKDHESNYSEKLYDCLHKISEINNFPVVLSYFEPQMNHKDNVLMRWKKKLSNFYNEMEHKLNQFKITHSTANVSANLEVIKKMSCLDEFLLHENESFANLYRITLNSLYSNVDNIIKRFNDALNIDDYDDALKILTDLEQSKGDVNQHYLDKCKIILKLKITALVEETQSLSTKYFYSASEDRSNETVLSAVVDNLKRMNKIKILEEFSPKENERSLSERQNMIIIRIEGGLLEQMKEIDIYLKADNYPKAAQCAKAIKAKFEILDYHCSETLHSSLKNAESRFKDSLNELVKAFKEKDIIDYRFRPPIELIDNLKKDPTYIDTINTLEKIILDKFREEMGLLKMLKRKSCKIEKTDTDDQKSDLNVEQLETITVINRERTLRQLEKIATSCLPENLSKIINSDINDFKEDIVYEQTIAAKDVDQAMRAENLQAIDEVYKRNLASGNQEAIGKIEEFMQSKISKYCDDINTLMNSENESVANHTEFSENMRQLIEYINFSLNSKIKLISKQPYELVNKLKLYIENTLTELERCFEPVEDSTSTRNSSKVESTDHIQRFFLIKEYVALKSRKKDIKSLDRTSINFPNFDERFIDLLRKIINTAIETERLFKKSLENWNIIIIKNILNKMLVWNPVLVEIKTDKSYDFIKNNNYEIDYSTMKIAVIDRINEMKNDFDKFELITDTTKASDYQRNCYYQDLKNKLETVKLIKELELHFISSKNGFNFENEVNSVLQIKIDNLINNLEKSIKNLDEGKINESNCKLINLNYVHLKSFVENVETFRDKCLPIIESSKQRILDAVDGISSSLQGSKNIDSVVDELIKMKVVSDAIPVFKEIVDKRIDDTLAAYKKISPSNILSKLGTALNGHPVGKVIINEHSIFEGFALASFSKRVAPHGIDYVIEKLSGDLLNKKKLRNIYDEFLIEYNQLLKKHLQKNIDFGEIIGKLNILLAKSKDQGKWNVQVIGLVPKLVAYIFVIWTLKKASLYFEVKELEDAEFYIRKPHPAQVIAIFRLLSVGDDDPKLRHNLCEVGTGEGKSVILAVTASIFALCGFDVSCVCYSKYLSERDYNDFQVIFDTLGVGDRIKYGTFNEIAENIINEEGLVRDAIKNLISALPFDRTANKKSRTKILLIDEVDVFLKNDFYGNLYRPVAPLQDSVKPLIQYIWNNRNTNLQINTIKSTPEYETCCRKYKNWEFLIEESIKSLLLDLKTFNKPEYVVKNDKIGYVEQDAVSFSTVYGYRTLFAYFSEHEKGRITSTSLDKNVFLQVKCGKFSYSEIPNKFNYIIGVTGTLKTLTEPELNIVENEYKINKKTYLPSVFGANQLTYVPQNDVHVENTHDYHNKIATEIAFRISGKLEGTKRAVLVFFESKEALMKFYNSEAFLPNRHVAKILTEEDNLTIKEKDLFVKDSTRSGAISLITRSFGRGTDFVSMDDTVISNGGVHVLQTFLSEQYSEEVQIKGRTARQGDPGSYSMVLLDKDLEKYSVNPENISEFRANIYDFIHDKRNEYFLKHYNSDKQFKEFIKTEHQNSIQLLESIKTENIEFIKNYLREKNKGAEIYFHSKTLCLIDATGSMGELLIQVKNKVHEMFKDAIEILEEAKINPTCFQLQFGVYRDYDCGINEILQLSPWETKPDDLYTFMTKIDPKGGGDYEKAIEIALRYANLEFDANQITQVILIGGAPAKRPDQINKYRIKYGGESLWNKHFGPATDYRVEAQNLSAKNVQVHTFYLDEGAKANFEEIASITKATCQYLNVSIESSEQSLKYLVTYQLLANIGESCGRGNVLAKKYMKQFARAST